MKSRFQSALEGRIAQRIEQQLELLSGGNAPDYPSYRDLVGYIRGLRDAIKLCEETEEDME